MDYKEKFIKKIDKEKGSNSAKMNTQDIEDLLAETPEAVIYLYRLVDTHNFKVNGKDCDPLCDYLLSERSPLKNIPVNLTYAGKSERDELGWIELDYRSDDRNGYPKNCKDKSEFDKKNLNDISETHLAMRIFRQGRKNDKIGKIPDLGYILDYQMPIGGKNSKLYRINRENKNMYPEKGRDYGIHVPKGDKRIFSLYNCDLVAYDDLKKQFIILELKIKNSHEPLIRAILEAYTYKQLLNTKKAGEFLENHYKDIICVAERTDWRSAPLLYFDGKQAEEYVKMSPRMRELLDKLDIEPIWYDIKGDAIQIKQL